VRLARALPFCVAACMALLVGCHLLAVPIASSALKPRFPATTPASLGLAYRDVELRGARGTRLPAWLVSASAGAAPRGIVVLLAENGGNRSSPRMLRIAGEVARMGLDALLVDLRGHGQSSGVNTYGLGETLDLLEVLAALRREAPDRPIAAAGFSLGAACILRAMSITDSIRAAAVFASYARLDRDLVRHELEYQGSAAGQAWLARLVSPRLLLASLGFWAGFPRLPEPADLHTDRPVLLFHCTGDPEIPFAQARAIAAGATAPLLELRLLERDAHIPPLTDAEVWDAWTGALRDLLDRAMP
jgi:dienelactone hydrolase